MQDGSQKSYCDLARATKLLQSTIAELEGMTDDVANARVIKEMHNERMKQALAKGMAGASVDSMAKAEVMARVDHRYLAQVETLAENLLVAEKVLIKRVTLETKIEALRSAISLEKALMELR